MNPFKFLPALLACQLAAGLAAADTANPPRKIKIILIGDSTMTDNAGWGLGFKQFLDPARTELVNASRGGRSSMSYMKEGSWTNALALKGDYYLIQFGHNNEPGKPGRSTDMATFVSDMKKYVDDTRAIGAKPVLVTPLVRRQWDKGDANRINSSLAPYAGEVRKIAAEKNVPLVELHDRSKELCESLGKEKCLEFSPTKTENGTTRSDGTHLTGAGHVMFARLVVAELRKVVPALAPVLLAEPINPNPEAADHPAKPTTPPSGNAISADPQPVSSNPATMTAPAARSPITTGKIFDVKKFGATGDGKTYDTEAIQKALDTCAKAGGGTVEFPAGTYWSKPINLKGDRLTVQLDEGAKLQASDDFADFSDTKKHGAASAFVNANGLKNLTITGKGIIDGSGAKWWAEMRAAQKAGQPEPRRRPRLVVLQNCMNLHIQGITIQNSPSFHLVPSDCENVAIENVTIKAPADSPNTDATDPSACRHIRYRHCTFDVGDDNIAIKSGHIVAAHPNRAVEDMLVEDCTFLAGHGMSIGSETTGGVKNLTVHNCTFDGTTSGIRIKSDRSRGGEVEGCLYENLTMKNVKIPVNITCYYPKIPKTDSTQPMTASTPRYHNLRIVNLTAESPQSAGFVVGLPESRVTDLTFENVRITAPKGLTVRNTRAVVFKNSSIKTKEGGALILETGAEVSGLR